MNGYQHGVNLGGWLSQCKHDSDHYSEFITEKDIKIIAEWGLDHVRVPIDYEAFEMKMKDGGSYGFYYLDCCREWCTRYHLNMIIDLHRAKGFSFWDFEKNNLFQNPELQETFICLWEEICTHYKDSGNEICFELLNEVVEDTPERWNALANRTVERIRRIVPKHKIIIGGIRWNSIDTMHLLELPKDDNIVYTFHCYDPFLFTHQKASWVKEMPKDKSTRYPDSVERYGGVEKIVGGHDVGFEGTKLTVVGKEYLEHVISKAKEFADERKVEVYCGEYGVIVYADADSSVRWFCDFGEVLDNAEIGRAVWTYKGMSFPILGRERMAEIIPLL